MKLLSLSLLFIVAAMTAPTDASAQQVVLDFEDLTGFAPMPAGYGGIADWGEYAHSDTNDPNYPPASGVVRLIPVGAPKPILFGTEYVFDGASFAGQQLPFESVWFELYHKGSLVHTSGKITATIPHQWLASGYQGMVDEVHVKYNSVNVFCVDDWTYTIPPSQTSVDITCNGGDAGVQVPAGTNARIDVDVVAGPAQGTPVDIWVVLTTPFGLFCYNGTGPISGWNMGVGYAYATAPLTDVAFTALDRTVPAGAYVAHVGIDGVPDGKLSLSAIPHRDKVDFTVF